MQEGKTVRSCSGRWWFCSLHVSIWWGASMQKISRAGSSHSSVFRKCSIVMKPPKVDITSSIWTTLEVFWLYFSVLNQLPCYCKTSPLFSLKQKLPFKIHMADLNLQKSGSMPWRVWNCPGTRTPSRQSVSHKHKPTSVQAELPTHNKYICQKTLLGNVAALAVTRITTA